MYRSYYFARNKMLELIRHDLRKQFSFTWLKHFTITNVELRKVSPEKKRKWFIDDKFLFFSLLKINTLQETKDNLSILDININHSKRKSVINFKLLQVPSYFSTYLQLLPNVEKHWKNANITLKSVRFRYCLKTNKMK